MQVFFDMLGRLALFALLGVPGFILAKLGKIDTRGRATLVNLLLYVAMPFLVSGAIASETKRLRFQVDKVLQMSMFDNKNNASLKMKELDANELISGIVNTFTVKVEQNGGKLTWQLDADDPFIYVDEMHFTNVVFNLMDNAVKYRKQDVPFELEVPTCLSTWTSLLATTSR